MDHATADRRHDMADDAGETQAPPPAPPQPAGDAESGESPTIFAHRIGCLLHVLHLAVNAGMECIFFMGPLGKGSWHEWEDHHLVALLGTLWYNTSKSDSSCISWRRFQNLIFGVKGVWWKHKFIRPAETRWMVIWDGAAVLEERWEEVRWLHLDWAAAKILGTPYIDYWFKSACMMDAPLMRVHAKFCVALRKAVLSWAYNWIRGEGGYFLKGTGGVAERLPPGMRLAEAADFSLLLVKRLEELRTQPEKYFPELLAFARSNLEEAEVVQFFCKAFAGGSSIFFCVLPAAAPGNYDCCQTSRPSIPSSTASAPTAAACCRWRISCRTSKPTRERAASFGK